MAGQHATASLFRRDRNEAPVSEFDRKSVLDVRNLNKTYQGSDGETIALDDVSFSVNEGEFVAIVGPSGCGKSTLLKILTGLLAKSSGELSLRGETIAKPRSDIGIVFQSPVLFPWRNVLGNILLPVDVLRRRREAYQARALDLIDLVGLKGFERKYPWQLSGGMQQRVAISRGLIHDPTMLLMDEPFGALDAMTREHMNIQMQRIWMDRKKTILFITHSIPEAVFLADRVFVMTPRPGRIQAVEEIHLERPRGLEVMNTPEFGKHVRRIRDYFSAVGGLD